MLHQSFASLLQLAFGLQLLAVSLVLLGLLLLDRARERAPLRRLLEAHFAHSLLSRMLERRGRNAQAYLEQVSTPQLQQHLLRCKQCAQRGRCVGVLREGRRLEACSFCPNEAVIRRLGVGAT